MSMSVGLGNGSRSANAAAARMKMVQAIAAQNSGPNRGARLTGVTATSSFMLSSSVAMTDPGIEHRVEHVDNEVHQDKAAGDKQHHTLQNDEVPGVDCANEKPADAGQRENRLHNHGSANKPADVDSGDGDKSERRWLQRMYKKDARRLQSFGLGQG